MKYINKITHLLLMIAVYSAPAIVYAGGPGFKDDVKTWNSSGDDDNDDDNSNNYGDDDDNSNQYGDDDNGDDDYCDDDANEIPLDGGLSFLAVAGAAYGVKRIRDRKAKK